MGQMGSAPFASTRRRRRDGGAFSPLALYANGEAGGWYDPSDLTPEKVSWRRNLLTYSEQFDNSAWTKSNASILSNLLTWSEQFDNAAWTKDRVTVSANAATAPDGTLTADKVLDTAVGLNTYRIYNSLTLAAQSYTMTVWAKAAEYSWCYLRIGNALRAWFNLSNGTVGTVDTGLTASIADAGNGWYRLTCTIATATAGAGFGLVGLTNANGAESYTPTTGGMGIFVWGAQLVPGTTAQTYTPTTSAAAPIPFTAPDGSATADKLVEDTSLVNDHRILSSTAALPVGTTYTTSFYAKAAERTFVRVFVLHVANTSFTVSLTDGSVTFQANNGNVTASATAVGNGWYRVQFTYLVTVASANSPLYMTIAYSAAGTITGTGDGSSGVLLFGAQYEFAPTASSYQRITDFTSDFLAAFPQHALYQDSAGTTPVTALGQPVGLVLDKSKGGLANLGPELVTNGDFSSGTTGWTISGAWAVVSGQFVKTGGSNATAQQTILTIGRTYLIELDVIAVSGILLVYTGTGTSVNISTTGRRRAILTCSGDTNLYVACFSASTATIDNITVREVPGAHAIQATSASRPTCDARVNLLTSTLLTASTGVTVTDNAATAPDGTTRAQRVAKTDATTPRYTTQTYPTAEVRAGTSYTISRYFKRDGADTTVSLEYNDGANWGNPNVNWVATFAVTASGVTANTPTNCTSTVQDVGNGWFRCAVTLTTGASIATPGSVYLTRITGGSGVSVLTFGGDLRITSDASLPFQFVTSASDYADVQAPRYLTFDGVDDSLYTAASVDFATWTSGTRRNLLTYPSAFDNSAWAKTNTTITANNAVAPDGTNTADQLIENTANAQHFCGQAPSLGAGAYTFSVYYKLAAGTRFLALYHAGANVGRQFDGSGNSSAGLFNAPTAFSVTAVGNGWYRASITATISAGASEWRLWLADASNALSYTGDGASGYFIWGAQLELGSTATAFQDVGTDKMTVVTGVRKLSDAATGIMAEISANATANNGSFVLGVLGPATPYFTGSTGTVYQPASTSSTTYSAPVTNVVTGQYDIAAPSVILRANATQIASSTASQGTGTYGTYVLYIARRNNASLPFNGRLYQLIVRGAQTDTATVQQTERFVAGKTGLVI